MKKYLLLVLIFFSNFIVAQNESNLEYKKSIYAVKIKIENGRNYLELYQENKIQISTKNVESVNLTAIGKNLKITKAINEENNSFWSISPTKEDLKEGFYSLRITFKGKKGRLHTHEFLIEVKP